MPAGDAPALARALTELLDDPERQAMMGLAGKRAVSARFTERHHVEALLAAYGKARAGWERRVLAA